MQARALVFVSLSAITSACGNTIVDRDRAAADGEVISSPGGDGDAGAGSSVIEPSGGSGGSSSSAGGSSSTGAGGLAPPGVCPEPQNGWAMEPISGELATLSIYEIAGRGVPVVGFANQYSAYIAWREGPGAWQVQEFAYSDYIGAPEIGVGVDATGRWHLVYLDDGQLQHRYAPPGEAPVLETAASICQPSSLAIDDDGVIHVAGTQGEEDLCVGHRALDGTWSFETPERDAFPRGTTILAAGGELHVLSYGPLLQYARKNASGAWAVEQPAGGGIDQNAAVGPDGSIYVGHSESPYGSVLFTHGSLGAWTTEVLDDGEDQVSPAAPGIAVDGEGDVHLVYPNTGAASNLVYARQSAAWQEEIIASGFWAKLALDSAGGRHVVFASMVDSWTGTPCYAFKP